MLSALCALGFLAQFVYVTGPDKGPATLHPFERSHAGHQFWTRDLPATVTKITIIGEDNRRTRDRSKDKAFESAQGRVHCLEKPLRVRKRDKDKPLTPREKEFVRNNGFVAVAWLAIRDDIVIFSRHMIILDETKNTRLDFHNCYFEHIDTGKYIQFADAELVEVEFTTSNSNTLNELLAREGDVAIGRLKAVPIGGAAVPRSRIVVRRDINPSEEMKVAANFANNNRSGNREELTEAYCHSPARFKLPNGLLSALNATTCDTGKGSSGSAVMDGAGQIWGIVSGEAVRAKAGGVFSPADLSTDVVAFNHRLFEAYERLEARRTPD